MEAIYCDIPVVRSSRSHNLIEDLILAAIIILPLILIIKTEIEIYQFKKKQDEK